jgi:hypothetical protein
MPLLRAWQRQGMGRGGDLGEGRAVTQRGRAAAFTLSPEENHILLKAEAASGRLKVDLGWYHRYPARFASDVLTTMLTGIMRRAKGPLTACLDPFAGTGATLAACRQLGIGSMGVELTQLGVEIARLRLDPPHNIDKALELVEGWSVQAAPARADIDAELVGWLGDDNARALTGYLTALRAVCDERIARFGHIAISQALRPASQWLVGSVKVTADPTRRPPPIGVQLRRWARAMARDCIGEQQRVRLVAGRPAPAAILLGDACHLPVTDGSIDAAVTSPPYFVTYDYFEVNRLSYLTFGWPRPRELQVGMRFGIQTDGIGFTPPQALAAWYRDFNKEDTLFGRALRAYCQRMNMHIGELFRVLRPGGILAYAVANSTRKGKAFRLARPVSNSWNKLGSESCRLPRETSVTSIFFLSLVTRLLAGSLPKALPE